MRPKVLFVDHTAVMGGGELSLLDIARHFKASSRVVLFADGPFRERLAREGVPVEILASGKAVSNVSRGSGLLGDLRALPGVFSLARALARLGRDHDVLYANSQKSMIVTALAAVMARRPMIWHLRDLMSKEHFSAAHRSLAVRVASLFSTRIIANSEATRHAFIDSGGRADKVHVVYNGIDSASFERVTDEDVEQVRAELGLTGKPTIGVFSRLAPWKGQHVLLQAMAELPDVHAILVGEALFEGDKVYVKELRDLVGRLQLTDRVHFLGFRSDIPRLLRLCDVVAHTSVAPEPFGRVIVEGMLACRPVVATRAGGAAEIVDDGRTGRLVPPGDAAALAQSIRELLMVPGRAAALADQGRRTARVRFSLEAMLKGVEREITESIA